MAFEDREVLPTLEDPVSAKAFQETEPATNVASPPSAETEHASIVAALASVKKDPVSV